MNILAWNLNGEKMSPLHHDFEFYEKNGCALPSQLLLAQPGTFYFAKAQDGRIVCASQGFVDHLGLPVTAIIGHNDLHIFRHDYSNHFRSHDVQVMASGEPIFIKLEILPGKNGLSWFSTIKSPLRNRQGEIVGVEGLTRDEHQTFEILRDSQEFRGCIEFMEKHLNGTVSMPRLAMIAAMSLPTFNRRFKAAFGCTAPQFLRKLRLEEACKLLRQGRTITETVERCGFCDQSHLTLEFRRAFGLPPRRWLQQGGDGS